jgi:signal transduction histidine kinase/CheY-like chemotaxis protein
MPGLKIVNNSSTAESAEEQSRIEALEAYSVLDTLPEQEFEDLTYLASYICDTPIALISLLDENRQWFKSRHGLHTTSTPREISFCTHTILQKSPLIIEDSLLDERFRNNPLVTGDPKIRFYAGAPLTTPQGYRIGTICVIDHVPRQLSSSQVEALLSLARQTVSLLELRSRKNQAVEAHRVKTEFLANMSHEIRTPLNGIIGMTELTLAEELAAEQKTRLQIIHNCSHSLLNLLNDILDFSKLESGKVTVESVPFDIRRTTHETLELYQKLAQQKNIPLQFEISASTPQEIKGDPHRFRQILNNLLGNALKFTKQGQIRLEIKCQPTSIQRVEIQVAVHDSGCGIPQELQHKLFSSFAQVDASTTRKFGGTGLGLAICKGLCEAMGGRIWLESRLGQGSSFFFCFPAPVLPMASSSLTQSTSESDAPLDASSLSVLLVEDNRLNQMVMAGLLSRFYCACDIAQNGAEAIAMCKQKNYDLILMDCHMPEVDGFEASRQISQNHKISLSSSGAWRIVALTASAAKEDRVRCLESGMVDFLTKPILLKKIETTLSQTLLVQKNLQLEQAAIESSIDLEALKMRFEGLEDVLMLACQRFQQDWPQKREALQKSYHSRDFRELGDIAHSVKGMVSEFLAHRAVELCREIEILARQEAPETLELKFIALYLELEKTELSLKKLIEGRTPLN